MFINITLGLYIGLKLTKATHAKRSSSRVNCDETRLSQPRVDNILLQISESRQACHPVDKKTAELISSDINIDSLTCLISQL